MKTVKSTEECNLQHNNRETNCAYVKPQSIVIKMELEQPVLSASNPESRTSGARYNRGGGFD